MAIVAIKPKIVDFENGPVETKKREPKKVFPKLRLEHEFFPETKKWEVLKEYTVTFKLKMTGLSISRFSNDSEFDIIGVDYKTGKENE